jgi:hypothetical protein
MIPIIGKIMFYRKSPSLTVILLNLNSSNPSVTTTLAMKFLMSSSVVKFKILNLKSVKVFSFIFSGSLQIEL